MRGTGFLLATLVLGVLGACASRPPPRPGPSRPPAAPSSSAGDEDTRSSTGLAARLYAEHKYAEALVAYEQAYRLGHQPAALLGLAECHRLLKHVGPAYDSFEQLLALYDAQLSAEDKRTAQDAIQELGAITATLVLEISEPDAEIDVDGRPWGRSPMPKPRRIRASAHTVHVAKAGYTTFEQQVTLSPQEAKKLEVKLDVDRGAGTQQMSEAERKAAARAAFTDGVKLQEQKDCIHALARFETAERLYDAPTHVLHLAQCQAATGKLVEAQESYATLEHITLNAQAPDAFREAQDAGRVEAPRLKSRVPTLRLQTIPPAASVKGLVVQVNGARLPVDLVGIARPVNPGSYHVLVTAGGRTANADFELKEGETKSVDLRLSR